MAIRLDPLPFDKCISTIRRLVEEQKEKPIKFANDFGADIADVGETHIKAAGVRLYKRLKRGAYGELTKRAADALMDAIWEAGLTQKPAEQYSFRIAAASKKPAKSCKK